MKILERTFDAQVAANLTKHGLSPALSKILSARGVAAIEEVTPPIEGLVPYTQLKGVAELAKVLADAIYDKRRLLIVADYDADGATACAILMRGLTNFGANVGYIIPNRFEHGYGLTPAIAEIACAADPRPDYLVTVDNGIASHAGVQRCNELGVPVLVTDHHLPAETLPEAMCLVNPNQPGCPFPSKNLAGCGVAYYVLWALQDELVGRGWEGFSWGFEVQQLLPIVALGTVADVVSLDTNNRTLVAEGLRRIRAGQSFPGIDALAKVASREPQNLCTSDFGFAIGPRINAAGRLASMDAGVECLLSDDPADALRMAQELHAINVQRKEIEGEMTEEAVRQLVTDLSPERVSVVVHSPQWHQGVIGIVAGRLKEKVWRPTLVFADGNDCELKGSGRSIPGFHLRDALAEVDRLAPGLMRKYGGHAMAAGVTLAPGAFDSFRTVFESVARNWLTPAQLMQVTETDGALSLADMSPQTVADINELVWGQGFPEPLFSDCFEVVDYRFLSGGAHLKLTLAKDGVTFDAIKFRHTDGAPAKRILTTFRLALNTFRNETKLQLMLGDILPA